MSEIGTFFIGLTVGLIGGMIFGASIMLIKFNVYLKRITPNDS